MIKVQIRTGLYKSVKPSFSIGICPLKKLSISDLLNQTLWYNFNRQ